MFCGDVLVSLVMISSFINIVVIYLGVQASLSSCDGVCVMECGFAHFRHILVIKFVGIISSL